MVAIAEIDKSVLSEENEIFQQEANVELIVVKRGLWSTQNTYRNKMIEHYYKSLLTNNLEYSINKSQEEFAKKTAINDKIKISINDNIFNEYTGYEKALLIITSTSALALLGDENFSKEQIPNMFFKFFDEYDASEFPGIANAEWYKAQKIKITDDGIIIDE
jgi:hypothetical protein